MKVNYAKIAEGPFPDRGYEKGEEPDSISENVEDAKIVLRNWIHASCWGLPRALVADILDEEARKLRVK